MVEIQDQKSVACKMPTQGNVKQLCPHRVGLICQKIFAFSVKRESFLLGNFYARVGKLNDVHDVASIFGKATCNSNGNLWIELLQNCNIMISIDRLIQCDPQNLELYCILQQASADLHVDYVMIQCAVLILTRIASYFFSYCFGGRV